MNARVSWLAGFAVLALLITPMSACRQKEAAQPPTPTPGAPGVEGEGGGSLPPPTTSRAILYQRNHGGSGGPWDLRRIDADGTNDVEILADGNWNLEPAWNCRKRAFAFVSNQADAFLIFISDDGVGGSLRQVTSPIPGMTNQHDRYPSWQTSIAGIDQIVFTSNRPDQRRRTGVFQLWAMRSSGGALHQIVASAGNDSQPVWKPGTSLIAFSSDQADGNYEIFTIENGGLQLARVTQLVGRRDVHPTWSTQDQIAYESSNPRETDTSIVISPAAGGDARTVKATTTLIPRNVDPAFSPDGNEIVFAKQDATGQFDLYIMDRNGGNEKQVTNTANLSEREPEWIHGPSDFCP